MQLCPVCLSSSLKRSGVVEKKVMSKDGRRTSRIQAYRCENGHFFKRNAAGNFDDSFIEYVVFVYLRCLSLNTTITLIQATYEEDLLSKGQILEFLEMVADALPTIDDIDRLFSPKRSGYIALDGTWFSFNNEEIVLLVCFDPVTFDIIGAHWERDETGAGYERLLISVVNKLGALSIKGVYGDGDNGLIFSLKKLLPHVPFQLCVFHKELRMGEVVPVKRVHTSKFMTTRQKNEILMFQKLFREVIYAETKEASYQALLILEKYVKKKPGNDRFQKAYRSLLKNFPYTLTHFDYPEMHRDNNLLECFNGILKPRLTLMKSFKKKENLNRYLKLFLLEFRFHPLKESRFKTQRGQSPLQLGDVYLPKYYNFIHFLRTHLHLNFSQKKT